VPRPCVITDCSRRNPYAAAITIDDEFQLGAGDYVRGRTRDSTYSAATVGAKALIGSQRVNGFYQNAWQWRSARASSPIDESVGQWSAGIEFSAREGIWISTGFGGAYAEAEAPDRVVVFANLRWGVASTARLSPRVP
jgi:hypothetical protein